MFAWVAERDAFIPFWNGLSHDVGYLLVGVSTLGNQEALAANAWCKGCLIVGDSQVLKGSQHWSGSCGILESTDPDINSDMQCLWWHGYALA